MYTFGLGYCDFGGVGGEGTVSYRESKVNYGTNKRQDVQDLLKLIWEAEEAERGQTDHGWIIYGTG